MGKFWHIPVLLGLMASLCNCATTSEGDPPRRQLSKTERARLYVEVANGALLEGDPTGALQNLARAEKEDNGLPELHHSRALAFLAKHDLQASIESARQAVKIRPDYSDANNTLGKLLIDIGKYDEAKTYLDVAAHDVLYRDAYKAWTNLGILEYRKGDYLQSELYLDKAIQDAPNASCAAYYYRGHIKLKNMAYSSAIESYRQASQKSCAQFSEAFFALGVAYQQSKQFDMARKTFLEVEKRYPNTKLAEQALEKLKFLP